MVTTAAPAVEPPETHPLSVPAGQPRRLSEILPEVLRRHGLLPTLGVGDDSPARLRVRLPPKSRILSKRSK